MPDSIDLEIFSAFNCVWCYFSTRQIKRLKKKYDVNIVWRAFPLHPKIPPEGLLIEEQFGNNIHLRRKFKAAVDYDWRLSEKLGIVAAPSYVINQDKLIGPQSNAALENLLKCHGISKREQA
jgi:predicted DsbA family dithiol-disulfide isomerase